MADANSQPSGTPSGGAPNPDNGGGQPNPNGGGNGGGTPPAPTPPANGGDFDPTKLTGEQLNKVLENQELWKNPRLAGLLAADKELKDLKLKQDQNTEQQLAEQKKFEELAQKRGDDLAKANQRIQDLSINNELTTKLAPLGVVDLDGALKLIDRSKIQVNDQGQVTGIDDAINDLKTGKAYLFTGTPGSGNPSVGNPSNPTGGSPQGPTKFKESQLTPEFYKAHKAEVDEAGRLGLIEPDGPPPIQ